MQPYWFGRKGQCQLFCQHKAITSLLINSLAQQELVGAHAPPPHAVTPTLGVCTELASRAQELQDTSACLEGWFSGFHKNPQACFMSPHLDSAHPAGFMFAPTMPHTPWTVAVPMTH